MRKPKIRMQRNYRPKRRSGQLRPEGIDNTKDPLSSSSIADKELLVEVLEKGKDVFGDQFLLLRWLQDGNPELAGRSPMSLLGTEEGIRTVRGLLDRIKRGVVC